MTSRKTVLVIEDDEAVRTLVVRALSEFYAVQQATDAIDARTVLKKIATPDLILCDVMMPGISGTELIRSLKSEERFKQVPVIFLTAKSGPLDVIEGINAGARHYMTKPFQVKELLEKVAKAMK